MNAWPEFIQPSWLLLLPAVPVVVGWWLRRKPAAWRFSDTAVASAVNNRRGAVVRWCGALGRGLALAAAVVALAGPRWPDPGSRIRGEGIAILLVIDVSNSMNEEDFTWEGKAVPRIAAIKKAVRLLVAGGTAPGGEEMTGRSQDLIGLVTFTRWPKSSCPLTLSHDALLQLLDREETNKGGHDFETNVGDAIAWGVQRLNTAPVKHKVMVLASDGEQGEIPGALRPRQGAQLAAHFRIPILVIDVGSDAVLQAETAATQPAAESRRNARQALLDVAKITDGQYCTANDDNGLMAALRQLSGELDRIEKEEIETLRYGKYWEGAVWLCGSAFVLWLVVVTLELTVWRRLP